MKKMGRPPRKGVTIDYAILAKLLDYNVSTVRKHASSGLLDVNDLLSVVMYVTQYADPEVKTQIVRCAFKSDRAQLAVTDSLAEKQQHERDQVHRRHGYGNYKDQPEHDDQSDS